MRNLALFSLILLLSLSYVALAGLQLGGDNGRAILESLTENATTEDAATENTTNQSSANIPMTNNSTAEQGDLWSWGKIPVGHTLNGSGILVETPREDGSLVVIPPHGSI